MGKNIFCYDMDLIKEYLSNIINNSEKLELINRQLATTKRMIDEIKYTKVVEWFGGESDGWGICTLDDELSALIENAEETERVKLQRKIKEDVLQEIVEGIKNRLMECYIFLKSEYKAINRQNKIIKLQNKKVNINKDLNEERENSIGKNIDELKIKTAVESIISEVNKMGVKTRSVKTYLQEKLFSIWNEYQINSKAFGLLLKEFARKYFWENGINEIKRYQSFESFYKNIFLK